MTTLIFDIETDGLLDTVTKIHSLVIQDYVSKTLYSCTDNGRITEGVQPFMSIAEGIELLNNADVIVGHNIICYDIPVLRKLFPTTFHPRGIARDTLTISRLIYPDLLDRDYALSRSGRDFPLPSKLYGKHSLDAWGYRLSERKDTFGHSTDWVKWSYEMQKYCEQDVIVTRCLWERFEQMGYSKKAIRLEHEFQEVIFQQEQNGFPFDMERAEKLYVTLCQEREELREQLQNLWQPIDKGEMFTPKVNNKSKGYIKGVPIWKPKLVYFNPASRDDIAERLFMTYGWTPTEMTPTGKAKINDEVLESLDYPEAKQLARFFLLQKRVGQLGEGNQAWIKSAVRGEDGVYRLHGRVTTNGAVTGRCTHHEPNLAQVPAVGVPWGEEFRSLFYAPPGWSLLGCDASGLELRCLAHFMAKYDGGAYAQVILHGDIHWANAQNLGLVPMDMERDKNNEELEFFRNKIAKRFIYAFLYGAGGHKIGTVCGLTNQERERYANDPRSKGLVRRLRERGESFSDEVVAYTLKGNDLKDRFLRTLPALKMLIEAVQAQVAATNTLRGLDNRILSVRSQHSALNMLLQSAGALAVKKATCYLWDELKEQNLDKHVRQVAHVHDEYQLLVKEGYEERVGEIGIQAFRDAGAYFNFRCPLDGEYRFGKNWAETH